jgi:glycosyltransferase involved in cell wall biosynthesis
LQIGHRSGLKAAEILRTAASAGRPRIDDVTGASLSEAAAVAGRESVAAPPVLTVVVPVYNGGAGIVENISAIRRAITDGLAGESVETIVVSDGSIDDTAERLLAAREDVGIRVIHYDRNLGKGYAVKAGALASHGAWVALVDADLDLDPGAIPEYLELARREQLDFAIGSKRHPASVVRYPLSRRVASRCYQLLNRLLFRLDVRDTQVGLKIFNRAVVQEVLPLLLVKRFAFDLELLAVSTALGHGRIRELPVRLEYRFSGSQLTSRAVLRALVDTAAIFYRLRILRTYQRKRHLLRGAPALAPEVQPLITFIGDPDAAAALDYGRIDVVPRGDLDEAVRGAQGDVVALLAPRGVPGGNWLSAAIPFLTDQEVAAVVTPSLAPVSASLRERVAAAVLESRLGGGSRRSRYFPGNVRVVADEPVDSIVIRRADLAAALHAGVDRDRLTSWLAERGRSTVYTPDASIVTPPPPLTLPHLRATYAHARLRGSNARRTHGASLSGATTLSFLPVGCGAAGLLLLAVGPESTRSVGAGLAGAYVAAVAGSAALAGIRFRSARLGLLVVPALVATQLTYVGGFVRGLTRGG